MGKNIFRILSISMVVLFVVSCEKNEVLPASNYDCTTPFQDTSEAHPKANQYQSILETHRKNGLVGAVLLVKDKHGLWMGSDGKADIASNVEVKPCNQFLIASISKVFTAAAIYRYIDKGILSLDDPINKWIDESITNNIGNANEAQIKHLLAHTSGIINYFFQLPLLLDRFNKTDNNWTKEDILTALYGKGAIDPVGETYSYSNTNYLLLSMILESASGLSFEQVCQQEVFTPLNLSGAYYSETQRLPDSVVKGYVDLYNNGQYVESESLYIDDLGVGGDGGIIATVHDVAVLFEQLMKGNLISANSLSEMTNWFPEDEEETEPEMEEGFGIGKYNSEYGYAVTHNGLAYGFYSVAYYFPESDMTYVFFSNTAGSEVGDDSQEAIFMETMEVMFE